jgi:hypothetical protein
MNGDRPNAPQRRSRALRVLLTAAAFILGVPLLGRGCGSCMGYQDMVMERVNACPRARELLGSPIKPALVGLSCGSASTGGGTGRARWTMSVNGPKARGRYSFHVRKEDGQWRLMTGTLKAGDTTIDVAVCAVVGGNTVAAAQSFSGQVTSTVGAAPVAAGTACTATVTPGDGDTPCRTEVRCGNTIIYGATPKVGYASCAMEQGADGTQTLIVQDREFTPQGGDPALDLRAATGQLVVSDQLPSGMWAVDIKLGGGASAPAPAPTPPSSSGPSRNPGPTQPSAPGPTPSPTRSPMPSPTRGPTQLPAPAQPPGPGATPI